MATILIADDDVILAELVRYKLESEGHRVMTVETGDRIVAAAILYAPHLIILDWMMPALSGPQVMRQLRRNDVTAHIPLLMLSARNDPADITEALQAGADHYIVKPFQFDELLVQVSAMLNQPEKMIDAA